MADVDLKTWTNPDGTVYHFRDGDVQYKSLDSVNDLGLNVGSATISDAVTALIARAPARLFCNSSDFANAEVPNQYGEVEIVALAANRVAIWFYGQTSANPDRRMYLLNGTPTGTWVKYRSELDENYIIYDSVADLGLTSGSATIAGALTAMPNASILICAASDFAASETPTSGSYLGTIEITKLNANRAFIQAFGKTDSAGDYRMFCDSATGAPNGTWTRFTETSDFVLGSASASTGSVAAGSNAVGNITITKSGYTPIAIAGFNTGNSWLLVSDITISNSTTLHYTIRNVHASNSGSGTFSVKILYRKN